MQLLLVEGLLWSALVIVAWWLTLSTTGQELRNVINFTSLLSIAAGVRGFLGHGRSIVTATGLFSLSTAMFIGYSGLVLADRTLIESEWKYTALAAVTGLTAQIGTTALAWGRPGVNRVFELSFEERSSAWLARTGFSALVVLVGLHSVSPILRPWTEASAFAAICMLAVGLVFRSDARILSWSTVLVASTLVLYSEFFHGGTGRLRLVALACAIAVIYTARFQRYRLKFAIVAVIPLALVWLARKRLELQESLGVGSSEGRTGLESMIAPLKVLSLFLQSLQEHDFTPSYGYNLLSVPALLIPESVWPNQPQALGYELVRFADPGRYGDGIFSTVATSTGEGIFNFGWWGLPVVIIFAAFLLRMLDSLLVRRLIDNYSHLLGLLGLVLVAMLIGAVADYTWSGLHTYAARMLHRMPLFLLIAVYTWLASQSGLKKEPPLPSRTKALWDC